MRLKKSRSISAIEQGVPCLAAGDFLLEPAHDAAAVEGAGQLVELGELLDAAIGFLQFLAASDRAK